MDRKKVILISLLSLFITVVLLRLPSLFEPFTYGDEGVYLTLGQALRRGLVFYRDIHDNKPPLLYLLAAATYNFSLYRVLLFSWSLITIFAFYKLSEIIFPKNDKAAFLATTLFAVLTSIHTFEGNIANAENFMMLPTIIAFTLLFEKESEGESERNASKPMIFFIGTLFALAVLFKAPAGFDFAAGLTLLFLWAKKINFFSLVKKYLFLILGFIFPVSLTIVYYTWTHALKDYLSAAFLQNIGYLSSWSGEKTKATGLPFPLLERAGLVFLVVLVLFVLRNKFTSATKLVITWFSFSLFGALLSSRPYPHYLLQPLAPLALSFGFLYQKKEKLVPIVLTATFIFSFLTFKFWLYPNLPYYENFYLFALKERSRTDYLNYFGTGTQDLYQTASFLKANTSYNEKTFIWGNQPSIYALAERAPVGRYTVAYHIIDFRAYTQTIEALNQDSPRYVVSTGEEIQSFPAFNSLIDDQYHLVKEFGKIKIYERY